MKFIAITLTLIIGLFTGCGTIKLNPVTNETRTVKALTNPTKTVYVPNGMVWANSMPQTHGLRFPPGTYILEAEDSDYWYLRSGSPLEFRIFNNGQIVDARNIPGGLMIGKTWLKMVPAGGYIDGDGSTKVMIWKLGSDFLNREGSDWTKTFKN
jgi:hypothetical protein